MHLTNALALLPLLLFSTAVADFHIIEETLYGKHRTLPSNKYNCANAPKFGVLTGGSFGSDWFKVTGNTCGATALDFYKRADGHYQAYISNGDGTVQAECYDNSGGKGFTCGGIMFPRWEVKDKLVCYSYLCK